MTDTPHHTSAEQNRGEAVRGSAGDVVDSVMAVASNPAAYVIPGAYVAGKLVDAVSNVAVAKINASVELTKIYSEAGHPEGPGTHEK